MLDFSYLWLANGLSTPFCRTENPFFCLFYQLKYFLVLAAHAVAGAEDFFFVERVCF